MTEPVPAIRSLLFTPANRASAFGKALDSGADCVCLDLEDSVPPDGKKAARPGALAFLAEAAARDGFTGKTAIPPSNIAPINAAFTPSAEEIAEAQRIVAAFEASPTGLVVIDGRLIEAPVIRGMRRRLALAAAADAL